MPTRRLALIAALALAAQPALAAASKAPAKPHAKAAATAKKAPAAKGPTAPDDMTLGSPKAKVQVVEYASLSCPHCARFNSEVFPAFKAKYVDTGQVRYTLREMLTPPAEVAAAGFMLARCAGPSKYFTVVDQVFKSQAKWGDGDIKPVFLEIAKANGLTEDQFDACLSDQKGLAALQARVQAAVDAGVDSTPTFFVNGKKIAAGEIGLDKLDAAIAEAKSGKPKTGG
jgi:protein-disulfide isomerase